LLSRLVLSSRWSFFLPPPFPPTPPLIPLASYWSARQHSVIGAPVLPWFGARSPTCLRHTPPDRRRILPAWSRNRFPPRRGCRRASKSNCSPPISVIRARFGSRRTATSLSPNRSRGGFDSCAPPTERPSPAATTSSPHASTSRSA